MRKIIYVAGARPNFMKIAPILREADKYDDLESLLVHTGQHYDYKMSQSFFDDLGIKEPDYHLGCGGGTHAEQTASIMVEFEKLCLKEMPDYVLVVGDVNSTIAAGLVAKKLQVKLIHVEAGLRSYDRNMPEEINRLATDAITDIFFTTEKNGTSNLLNEGHSPENIHFVGHVMIDNLYFQLERLKELKISDYVENVKLALGKKYLCLTMHRPSNVDSKEVLEKHLKTLKKISSEYPIFFPCHPRTYQQIQKFGLMDLFDCFDGQKSINNGIIISDPLGYNDFLYLWKDCMCMLTDSGGLQEETTALKVPCLTLRENTERPVTVEIGSNTLVGADSYLLEKTMDKLVKGKYKDGKIPELWDGKSSCRIIHTLRSIK